MHSLPKDVPSSEAAGTAEASPSADTDLRDELMREIDRMLGQIGQLVGALQDRPGEPQAAIDALSEQMSMLQAVRETAQSGHPRQLASLLAQLPTLQTGVQTAITQATSDAAVQASSYTAEITEIILERSITQMADRLSASDFARMSDAQLALVDEQVASHIRQSRAAEARAHTEIEALAEAQGVDLSAYRLARARLQVDEEEARRREDTLELARLSLLQSTNSYYGAQEAGADPTFLAERRQQMEADEAALRLALRAEAAREAKALGKTGKAAEDHINAFEQQEMQAVTTEQAKLAEGRTVSDPVGRDSDAAENLYLEKSREEAEGVTLPVPQETETLDAAKASGFGEMAAAIGGLETAEEITPPGATPAQAATSPPDATPARMATSSNLRKS